MLVPIYVINILVAGYSQGAQHREDNVVLQHNKPFFLCPKTHRSSRPYLLIENVGVSSSYISVCVYMYLCIQREMYICTRMYLYHKL